MNLAQCIDPEWAQRFFSEAPRKRAKTEAPRIERRLEIEQPVLAPAEKPAAIAERIRAALSEATGPGNALMLAEIRESVPELTSLQLSTNVGSLRQLGHVDRAGPAGEYRYWLTAQGRELLLEG